MRDDVELVYDKECPVCEYYCQRIDIDSSAGHLVRVDARDDTPVMDEITERGLDIDEGMVVKKDGELFYGPEAIHQLALMSNRKGVINRLAYWTFRSRLVSKVLYPVFKACRNLLLKVLGRSRINNLQVDGKDQF